MTAINVSHIVHPYINTHTHTHARARAHTKVNSASIHHTDEPVSMSKLDSMVQNIYLRALKY